MEKKYSSSKLFSEFPDKGLSCGGLNKLLSKNNSTGSAGFIKGSGWQKSG